jgi:surface protein
MAWLEPMILTLTAVPADYQVELPLYDISGDFQVEWGDSVINTNIKTHTYTTSDTYTIQISVADDNVSKITRFGINAYEGSWLGSEYLTAITAWGDFNGIASLNNIGGAALTSVPITVPNTVTNMSYMFQFASNFNQDLSWNVGNVDDMTNMFYTATNFNGNIRNWNVGNVIYMTGMFFDASSFNQDIGNWDVGNVEVMYYMFTLAVSFNQDLSRWNVGQVRIMYSMFIGTSLNTANYSNILIGWSDLPILQSNVFLDGQSIYQYAENAYNELITTYNWTITPIPTILSWRTPMILTFTAVPADFPIDLPLYDISGDFQVEWGDSDINTNIKIHTYTNSGTYTIQISVAAVDNVSQITRFGVYDYYSSWSGSEYLTAITDWGDFNGITSLNNIGRSALTSVPITVPNTVTDMSYMFAGATSFNQDLSWDVGQVTNMSHMFFRAGSFNQDIGNWDIGQVTDMSSMFEGAISFNQDLSWNVALVENMSNMFNGATSFNGAIRNWDVGQVSYMTAMFADASSFNKDIGNWDIGQVTDMSSMFEGAISFNQDLSWNVALVENMSNMFNGATSFNGAIRNWDVGQVSNMSYMFNRASSFNQDLSWNVMLVTDIAGMFFGATDFNQNIGNWNVALVENMSNMFASATSFNQDIGNWNVGKVTNMSRMFASATSFNQDLSRWNVAIVTNMFRMFFGTSLNAANYSNILIGWNALPTLQTNVVFGGGVSIYQNAVNAYNELISTYNWTITPIPTFLPDVNPVIAKKKSSFSGNTVDSSNTNASRYSQIVRGINNGSTRFISKELNAFGYYSGGPSGSGAPPRNKF